MQALSQLSYGPITVRCWELRAGTNSGSLDDVRPGTGQVSSLFLVGHVADDVGDVLVTLLLLLDEGRIVKGLIDLDVVAALGPFALGALLALRLGIGFLKRDEFGVRRLRHDGILLNRRRLGTGGFRPTQARADRGERQDRRAFRAHDRVFVEVVKLRGAIAA